jgi:hypothetical protein
MQKVQKIKKMPRSKVLTIFTIMSGFSKTYEDINSLVLMGIEREKLLASKRDLERARQKTISFFKNIPSNLMSNEEPNESDTPENTESVVLLFLDKMVDLLKDQRGSKMFYLSDIKKKIKERILLIGDDNDINSGGVFKSEILIGLLSA